MGYKKYINDYRKEYIVKPNGKPGVTAVYIGKYFRFAANEADFKKTRKLFCCLSAFALICCILPLLFNSKSMHQFYVAVPQALSLFPIAHLLMGVANLYLKKPPLIREFRDKTVGRITTNSAATGCALAANAVLRLVYCFVASFTVLDVIFAILSIIGSASAWYVFAKRPLIATEECEAPENT